MVYRTSFTNSDSAPFFSFMLAFLVERFIRLKASAYVISGQLPDFLMLAIPYVTVFRLN